MLRRLLITFAATVIFGGTLVSCGDSVESGGALSWKSAVDVPVNFSMKVGNNLGTALLSPGCKDLPPDILPPGLDCDSLSPEEEAFVQGLIDSLVPDSYLLDIGKGTVPTTSDVMDFLRKLTDRDIRYSVGVTNDTPVKLTFYGMLFPRNDSAANISVEAYYDIIKNDSVSDGRVSIFGKGGLSMDAYGTGCYPDCGELSPRNDRLDTLVVGNGRNKKTSFSYRWLVMLERSDYETNLGDTASTSDSVSIKLRMRFSGVNSMDSLFTL
ncbi:MAG: hypothetical protein LBB74_09785 [Chitinispirillales bacterium]|jgi:hypothetical protein|nr:hypothetical protein [Chitinispirillales bacterium]